MLFDISTINFPYAMPQAALRMAWCNLVLEQFGGSINNENKRIEDIRTRNKTLLTQVENLTKANATALFDLSKASDVLKELGS